MHLKAFMYRSTSLSLKHGFQYNTVMSWLQNGYFPIVLMLNQRIGVIKRNKVNKQPTTDLCDRMVILSTSFGHVRF